MIHFDRVILSEDGEELAFKKRSPLKEGELEKLNEFFGVDLPDDFLRFYLRNNGANFFGIDLLSFDKYSDVELSNFFFHNWGNGDRDFINLNRHSSDFGKIFFLEATGVKALPVAPNFTFWISCVFEEISQYGVLFHPDDLEVKGINGLYSFNHGGV
ncbi:SMI1/KNR4 family protein [Roseivirga pacifica]